MNHPKEGTLQMRSCLFSCLVSVFMLTVVVSLAAAQGEESLVAYWSFDAGSGKDVKDDSGNGHDGVIVDAADWVDGKFGKALDFGAGGGYVDVPDDDALDLSDEVTVMGWCNLNEAIAGQKRLMSKNDSIFFLFDFGAPTTLDFLVKPNNDFVEATTEFEVGKWYHFAGTYDGDSLRIYINGEMESEKGGVPPIATSDLDLWIGADDWQPDISNFPGILDDIRIYSVALTNEQIKKAMEGPVAVEMSSEKLPVMWSSLKTGN